MVFTFCIGDSGPEGFIEARNCKHALKKLDHPEANIYFLIQNNFQKSEI